MSRNLWPRKEFRDLDFDLKTDEEYLKDIEPVKRITTIRKMDVVEIINHVIRLTKHKDLSIQGDASKYLKVLGEKLKLNPIQALFLCVFVDNCDDNSIRFRDFSRYFDDCGTINVIRYQNEIDEMVNLGVVIRNSDGEGNFTYRIPQSTLTCLCQNTLPKKNAQTNLSSDDLIDEINLALNRVERNDIMDEEFVDMIKRIFANNMHLECVQKIHELKLKDEDLKLFLIMAVRCILDDDNSIRRGDVNCYYNGIQFGRVNRMLEQGVHPLMQNKLIEQVCDDGHANPKLWRLTDETKRKIFSEFDLCKPQISSNLKSPDEIVKKELYYDDDVSNQIEKLSSMLMPERLNKIVNRLSEHGYRKGFACLFYGGPGTGKTETVLQIARATGRSIMQVDISTIRDKYVGETEKRIKWCFDEYRIHVRKNSITPILFFNEADALFTTRNEQARHGVDKMENAMQNIILQEMENLDGILIATTNLTGSFDSAFERRFLFKIEFTKPSPKARRHIWQSMIPGLSDDDALTLAERFDFSGGQIENIARKRVIDDILNDCDAIDINALIESCRHESLDNKDKTFKIGFMA